MTPVGARESERIGDPEKGRTARKHPPHRDNRGGAGASLQWCAAWTKTHCAFSGSRSTSPNEAPFLGLLHVTRTAKGAFPYAP